MGAILGIEPPPPVGKRGCGCGGGCFFEAPIASFFFSTYGRPYAPRDNYCTMFFDMAIRRDFTTDCRYWSDGSS